MTMLAIPVVNDEQRQRAFALGADLVELADQRLYDRQGKLFLSADDILMHHDFEKMPDDLDALLAKMRQKKAKLYKIATMAHSSLDALRMIAFVRKHQDVIGLCMGKEGEITRILAPFAGSPIMYAALSDAEKNAPGQVPIQKLLEIYRFRSLNPKSALFGLIGDPVEQSVGHLYHNPLFPYVKMRVAKEELSSFFRYPFFRGLSVTMPLKEAVLPFLDELDPEASSIGAVNTIVFDQGRRIGFNTDGRAALDAIGKVKGKRLAVIGAGGTARAIAFAARQRGADVLIVNRDQKRAVTAAAALGVQGGGFELLRQGYDILAKAVPGDLGIEPLAKTVVLDAAIGKSPFLQRAKRLSCRCISGLEMFVLQAEAQQKLWYTLMNLS